MDTQADRQERVAQLAEVTGLDEAAARRLLDVTDWNVENAIALHFAGDGGDDHGPGGFAAPATSPGNRADGQAAGPDRPGPSDEEQDLEDAELAFGAEQAHAATNSGWFGGLGRAMSSVGQAVLGVASEDFDCWFATRYGAPTPPFSKESFGDTVKGCLAEGKLLLVWLHQDESPATEVLCRDVLQNPIIFRNFRKSFRIWAGDVCRFEPGQIARLVGATLFPTLCVLQPLRNGYDQAFCLEWPLGSFAQPLFRISPVSRGELLNADEAIAALSTAAQDLQDRTAAREEQQQRRASQVSEARMLREAQDREFEESLLADQVAQVSRMEGAAAGAEPQVATVSEVVPPTAEAPSAQAPADSSASTTSQAAASGAAEAAAAAAESEAEEAQRQARGAEILATAEADPASSATAKLMVKFPSGERMQRVFRAEALLSEVYEWAHCCRKSPEPRFFEICTTFPTKCLVDKEATLLSLGLTPNAALMMKKIED